MIIISPFAKPGNIAHTQYEFSSFLALVETRYGLKSLGGRDTAAAKMEVMRAAGIHVADSPAALGSTMVAVLKG